MKLYIFPSELIIDADGGLPTDVADRMMQFHIMPVNQIRHEAGYGITASERSGYRSKQHEKRQGRAPRDYSNDWSRHTYYPHPTTDPEGKGATDWRTVRLENMPDFARRLADGTSYARLCYYPDNGFIHCDYKYEAGGRKYYIAGETGWRQVTRETFLKSIRP